MEIKAKLGPLTAVVYSSICSSPSTARVRSRRSSFIMAQKHIIAGLTSGVKS
jgi:hypothetical protein